MRWIAGVLVIVVAVAAGFLLWKMQEKKVVLDPAEVQRVAARLLPGAAPPPGLKAVLALQPEAGLEVAIFAPSLDKVDVANLEGGDLRIVIAHPDTPSGTPDVSAIAAKISAAQGRKAQEMDTLGQSPEPVSVGGKPYPAMHGRVALKSGGKRLEEYMTVLSPGKDTVVVLVTGPDGTFDRAAMDRFLAGLRAPEGAAMPSPGLPGGGASPAIPGAGGGAPAMPAQGGAPPMPGPPGPGGGAPPPPGPPGGPPGPP